MNKRAVLLAMIAVLGVSRLSRASQAARIIEISGEVKIRRGVEETWHPATRGMSLQFVDTILTLEGEVTLAIRNGVRFHLGRNSMLDIADLRKITRKEMFLFLMAEKVDHIPAHPGKTKLQIGNVSVVHGESKVATAPAEGKEIQQQWRRELNGAKALLRQEYYTNTVIKLQKIRNRYPSIVDFGEIQFLVGKAFEELDEPGQAVDAYQEAMKQSTGCDLAYINELRRRAEKSLKRLLK